MKKLTFAFLFIFLSTLTGAPADLLSSGETNKTFTIQSSNNPDEPAYALLAQAEEAHMKYDFEQSKELLIKALASSPSEKERAIAERRLATLEWRFFARYAEASEHLAKAETLNAEKADTFIEKSRMEMSLSKYDEAYLTAKKAISEAKDKRTLENAKINLAAIVVNRALKAALDNDEATSKTSVEEKSQLTEAYNLLLPIFKAEPGLLTPSRLQLRLSLLLGDTATALEAWRSYYHVQDDSPAGTILSRTHQELKRVFANWHKTKPSKKDYEQLVIALAESRSFEEAALIAHKMKVAYGKSSNKLFNDIVEYALFCRRIRKISEAYYRLLAIKQGKPDEYKNQLRKEAERLWGRLSWPVTPPKFVPEIFNEEMSKRFGASINMGMTSGYFNAHIGHRVIDEERTISQYNHTAKLRFVSLDTIVSNGFPTWAWDGRSQVGGWATATTITQIRPAYAGDAINIWRLLNDPVERRKRDDEIIKDSAGDEAKALTNPYAFLPGLHNRLRRKGQEQLLARLRSRGLTGSALRLTFLAEYDKAVVDSSIFAHEGRHAIDDILKLGLASEELEYRGKLSEIAFASDPLLTITAIVHPSIGDDTSHGKANLRIMKGIVKWMEENKSAIKGLDSSKPLLPQFDLLTDEQIRTVFRSMDPFFKG